MAPHSNTLAWKIPWMEEPGRLQSMGSLESDTTERLPFHFSLSCIGEGNDNPLQCSCLESPGDGVAWWAAVYGVMQSRTRLKWLSKIFYKVQSSLSYNCRTLSVISKTNAILISGHSSFYSLSLWICLFWIFQWNHTLCDLFASGFFYLAWCLIGISMW